MENHHVGEVHKWQNCILHKNVQKHETDGIRRKTRKTNSMDFHVLFLNRKWDFSQLSNCAKIKSHFFTVQTLWLVLVDIVEPNIEVQVDVVEAGVDQIDIAEADVIIQLDAVEGVEVQAGVEAEAVVEGPPVPCGFAGISPQSQG